jgi:medium-chain acyl-[acyl-carrier-protein] hydrolase
MCLIVSGRRAPHIPDDRPISYDLSDREFKAYLAELNGTPEEILNDAEMLDLMLPTLRADFQLAETYRPLPGPRLRCPVIALGGGDDDETREDRLDAWRAHTCGSFESHIFPGDHFFVHSHEEAIGALIGAAIARHLGE